MDRQTWQRKGLLAAVGLLAFVVAGGAVFSSFQWINQPFPGFFLYGNLTVAPDFLPQWSGKKEGLNFLDRVLEVDGLTITDRQAVYERVRSYPAGTPFQYMIERERQHFRVTVPSMRFSFHDWLLTFGGYVLTGLGFLVIGFTPFYLRSKSPAARTLFLMVSAIFLWFTSTFDFLTGGILPKEVRVFAFTLTPTVGIHLGLLLGGFRGKKKRHFLFLCLIYGVSFLLGFLYSFTFHGPFEVWRLVLRLAYGYSCVAAVIFLLILWRALNRCRSDLERARLRVVCVGAVLGFFLPTLGTVLTSFFHWALPYNLLLIPTVFFPLSVAYALLKYSLFDLDVVLKVGITRGALTGALLLIYVLVVSVLSISVGFYERDLWVAFFFSVLVVVVFNPLLRWIEGVVDRYLDPKEYDPVELQNEVSLLLRSLARPQAISSKFIKLVAEHVGIADAALFFLPKNEKAYVGAFLDGNGPVFQETLEELRSLWICHMGGENRGIAKDEVRVDPRYSESRALLMNALRTLNSELLISIAFERDIFGFVSFGKKRSGRSYSADDFRLLCHLADQVALSLENGMLFEESEQAKESYRRLYDESEMMNKKLLEANRVKKEFVANICHELRTPISTILGYTEVLSDPTFAGDQRAILERVVINSQDLSQLMDSLLNFSRLESDALGTTLEAVNIREILQSFDMMAQRLTKSRPIRVRIGVTSPVEIIETDPNKLQQILMHLLTNAFKFTERGEIVLQAQTVSESGDHFVEVAVSDTGIGIDERDREIIFEEFRQLDGSSTRQYGGTGLGLNLCKKLAESLGGRIKVESEVGKGSRFSLRLPLRIPTVPMAA